MEFVSMHLKKNSNDIKKRTRFFQWLFVLLMIPVFVQYANCQDIPKISVETILSKPVYSMGDTILVALKIKIPDKHHLYDNPKGPGIGKPMEYAVKSEKAIVWNSLLKQKSKKFTPEVGGWVYAFEGDVCFFLQGIITDSAATTSYKNTLNVTGLICDKSCYPVSVTAEFTVTVGVSSGNILFNNDKTILQALKISAKSQTLSPYVNLQDTQAALSDQSLNITGLNLDGLQSDVQSKIYEWKFSPQNSGTDMNIFLAIVLAFIAGIILNAMPCVLPVLGVKILSFAQSAGMDRKKTIIHSLAFSAGVISVFILLAVLASFASFSWGRQFQDPKALIAIISVIVVFALGLFDVYMFNVSGSIANSKIQKRGGIAGDFFKGVFATILATPCSGPFLGAVLAWSMLQPAYAVFIVYTTIGLGMSFPYILLSTIPKLSKYLPKPGNWMDDFKKIMGFLLIGFAVYLMIGLPSDMIVPTVLFCVILAFGVVVFTRIAPYGSSVKTKILAIFSALLIIAAALYASFMVVYPSFSNSAAANVEKENDVWVDFEPELFVNAQKEGRNVILDFTANWCMNCQYNYIMVLTKKDVVTLIKEKNVLALKVDVTSPDAVHDSLLRSLGSQSIPFLAIFSGTSPDKPVVMRDVLTKGSVLRELNKLEKL
jgi:thiol:disulfide interchange protein